MPPATSPTRPQPVRIRRDVLDEHRTAAGINNDVELAELLHVAPSTVRRVLAHKVEPSTQFIHRLLRLLPDATYEDLFSDEPETSSP